MRQRRQLRNSWSADHGDLVIGRAGGRSMTEPWNQDQDHEHSSRCWWDLNQARWVCSPSTSVGPADLDPDEPPAKPLDVQAKMVV
jgi:hypothetical protein